MKAQLFSKIASVCVLCMAFVAAPAVGIAKNPDGLEILRETSKGFASLAKKATPAVVFIETSSVSKSRVSSKNELSEGPFDFFNDDFFHRFFGSPFSDNAPKAKKARVYGSGFIVSSDGYIITNNHVVQDAETVTVITQGEQKHTAKVIGIDPKTDIAVVKIEGTNLPFITLGDSTALEVGEWVMAIGNPFGLEASVTVGVVSAKGRNQLHLTDFDDFIQTDAAINPGNSGGPLINMDGQVIGMNTAIVSPNGGGYIGIGFAVPSSLITPIMKQLISTGKVVRGFLGISMQAVDGDLATSFGLNKPEGALIAEVIKNSPAESAGLKSGDVILKYDNQPITNISEFRNNVSLLSPGTKLNLVVYRDGKMIDMPIVVGTQSDQTEEAAASDQLGIVVDKLTPELAQKYDYTSDEGVIVTKVIPGSLAERAGIKPGTLIIAVDRKKMSSVDDFKQAVEEAVASKRILLLLRQGNTTRYLSLKF